MNFAKSFPQRGPSGSPSAFGGAGELDASRDTAVPQWGPVLDRTSAVAVSRDGSLPRTGPVGGSSQRGPRLRGASGALRRLVASGALAIGLGVASLSPSLALAQADTSRVFSD